MVCANCQRRISSKKRRGTKFCSARCRTAAFRARRRDPQALPEGRKAAALPASSAAGESAPAPAKAQPTLELGTKGARLERLLLRIAPANVVGYRLGFPDYRARISWFPNISYVNRGIMEDRKPLCFLLRPFELPILPTKGAYLLELLDAEGKPVQRPDWAEHSGVQIEDEAIFSRQVEYDVGKDHWWDGDWWGDPY